jgi:hypothetical protein
VSADETSWSSMSPSVGARMVTGYCPGCSRAHRR